MGNKNFLVLRETYDETFIDRMKSAIDVFIF